MIAHVGAVPVEEFLPTLAGAGAGLLVMGGWLTLRMRRLRLRRRREPGT